MWDEHTTHSVQHISQGQNSKYVLCVDQNDFKAV